MLRAFGLAPEKVVYMCWDGGSVLGQVVNFRPSTSPGARTTAGSLCWDKE